MVNPMRIKEVTFSGGIYMSGSPNAGSVFYTDFSINGQIQQVEWITAINVGSMMIYPSGLPAQVIWQRNTPSGAAWQVANPYIFPQNAAGSIANQAMIPFVVNEPLVFSLGSCGSYAAALGVTAKVKYI